MIPQLATVLFAMIQGIYGLHEGSSGVKNDVDIPINLDERDLKMRDDEFPFIFIVILGSALGLILTIASIVYWFSQEDPSKTNIVYKLSYQRLKTE